MKKKVEIKCGMESFVLEKENAQRNAPENEGSYYCKKELIDINGERSPKNSRDLNI